MSQAAIFAVAIDDHVASCGVLLAMVGKDWLDAKDVSGQRRLDDPNDFVRLETASALKRDIPVIPVLVRGAIMPRADQLPQDLAELAFRHGVELTHSRWDSDLQVSLKALRPYVDLQQKDVSDKEIKSQINKEVKVGDIPKFAAILSARKYLLPTIAVSVVVLGIAAYIVNDEYERKNKEIFTIANKEE